MSNESTNPQQEPLEQVQDTEVVTDEAALVDELTQANFRIEELEQALAAAEEIGRAHV